MRRVKTWLAGFGFLAMATTPALAVDEITIIVNSAAGGPPDFIARVLAEQLESKVDVPVIVENQPGVGGASAAALFSSKPADGSVLMVSGSGPLVFGPLLASAVTYDPLNDFTPVVNAAETPTLLAVNSELNINSLEELLEAIRADPGSFIYGSTGVGTPTHLSGKLVEKEAGVTLLHIPYNGAPAASVGVASGEVSMYAGAYNSLLPHVHSGAVKLVASMAQQRLAALPDTPSTGELGYPQLDVPTWFAVFLPKGASDEVVKDYEGMLLEALSQDSVIERFETAGFGVLAEGSETFKARLASEVEQWTGLVKEMGLERQ